MSMWSGCALSRVVRGAVSNCFTPTQLQTRTGEGGGGMPVRFDSGTCGTGAVRSWTLDMSRIPLQPMYQRELKRYRRSCI